MSFELYHVEVGAQSVQYDWVKPVPLSGPGGPVARFVRAQASDGAGWILSARELVGLSSPGGPPEEYRIVFDLEPRHEWRVALCELDAVSGVSGPDSTRMVMGFKTLLSGRFEQPSARIKRQFEVPFGPPLTRFFEPLVLKGGSTSGAWTWGEPELALGGCLKLPNGNGNAPASQRGAGSPRL